MRDASSRVIRFIPRIDHIPSIITQDYHKAIRVIRVIRVITNSASSSFLAIFNKSSVRGPIRKGY